MASVSSFTPITSTRQLITSAGTSIPAIRLRVELALARRTGALLLRNCLFDTGAPLCVVPRDIHQRFDLAWKPIPGPWPPGFTTWLDVPCDIGSIEVWTPHPQSPFFCGPKLMLAKFVQGNPSSVPGPIPVLLGLNFLSDHNAEVEFQCHQSPAAGVITFP